MRYIDSWLTGLGLEYIIPKLKANGITTPKKLAQLTLRDRYDVVGVEDAEDRKKLYFLIQRLHTVSVDLSIHLLYLSCCIFFSNNLSSCAFFYVLFIGVLAVVMMCNA